MTQKILFKEYNGVLVLEMVTVIFITGNCWATTHDVVDCAYNTIPKGTMLTILEEPKDKWQ